MFKYFVKLVFFVKLKFHENKILKQLVLDRIMPLLKMFCFPLIESALALAKRADGKSLSLASEILSNAGEQEQARILAFQALELFKKSKDKNGMEKLLEKSKVEEIHEEIQEFIKNTTFDKINTNGDLEE